MSIQKPRGHWGPAVFRFVKEGGEGGPQRSCGGRRKGEKSPAVAAPGGKTGSLPPGLERLTCALFPPAAQRSRWHPGPPPRHPVQRARQNASATRIPAPQSSPPHPDRAAGKTARTVVHPSASREGLFFSPHSIPQNPLSRQRKSCIFSVYKNGGREEAGGRRQELCCQVQGSVPFSLFPLPFSLLHLHSRALRPVQPISLPSFHPDIP